MASEINFQQGLKLTIVLIQREILPKCLPKTNYTSETKCLAVFLMGIRWPFKKCVQILGLLWIFSGNVDFVLLMKAQKTQKKINLTKLFFVNKVRADTSNSLKYLIWLN